MANKETFFNGHWIVLNDTILQDQECHFVKLSIMQ